ncbi:hypothetical protein QBC46DRAFT_347150 [Diplogelasinospora grovesii]|uniref:Uncharacterized protein n=1 Tax=Diplogelasinospora grovesii TaxID=303347 RepID=A0AAN6MYM7_9PEZI|nr:hypothetical protein QBC46DRAFT_347150 [Diplogelasinospora grovesii]
MTSLGLGADMIDFLMSTREKLGETSTLLAAAATEPGAWGNNFWEFSEETARLSQALLSRGSGS